MSKWNIENTTVFPCKTSTVSKKYVLNKFHSMRLVVLSKCMNFPVNKTTNTGTGCNYLHIITILLSNLLVDYS